jgi:hypothetical protein
MMARAGSNFKNMDSDHSKQQQVLDQQSRAKQMRHAIKPHM